MLNPLTTLQQFAQQDLIIAELRRENLEMSKALKIISSEIAKRLKNRGFYGIKDWERFCIFVCKKYCGDIHFESVSKYVDDNEVFEKKFQKLMKEL